MEAAELVVVSRMEWSLVTTVAEAVASVVMSSATLDQALVSTVEVYAVVQ